MRKESASSSPRRRFQKPIEEPRRIVRTRRRLRMVLHRVHRLAGDRKALDRAVVQVYLGDGAGGRQRIRIDGEAVVLAGDGDATRGDVAHRLVPAMVAELELEGP